MATENYIYPAVSIKPNRLGITRGGFLLVYFTYDSNMILCKYKFNRTTGVCVCVSSACIGYVLYNNCVFPPVNGCVLSRI